MALCLIPALSGKAGEAQLTLEEACAKSDLIVLGVLRNLKPFSEKDGEQAVDGVRAEIVERRVLFGHLHPAPDRLKVLDTNVPRESSFPVQWSNLRGVHPQVDHKAEADGKERIWCLTREPNWSFRPLENHPGYSLEHYKEAVAAIQARLAADRKTLTEAKVFWIKAWENQHAEKPAECKSFERLCDAGPDALSIGRELLEATYTRTRAWGCRLAGEFHYSYAYCMESLMALFFDETDTVKPEDASDRMTLGTLAIRTLGIMSEREFRTPKEAWDWVNRQFPALQLDKQGHLPSLDEIRRAQEGPRAPGRARGK